MFGYNRSQATDYPREHDRLDCPFLRHWLVNEVGTVRQ
jgi:hypothetical protein